MLIQDWAARNGYVYAEMSPSALDFVIRETVADRAKNPDGATQVEVSVDDGRVSRRYQTASGTFRVRDEWWDLLRPATASPQGAFSVRLSWQRTPHGARDARGGNQRSAGATAPARRVDDGPTRASSPSRRPPRDEASKTYATTPVQVYAGPVGSAFLM